MEPYSIGAMLTISVSVPNDRTTLSDEILSETPSSAVVMKYLYRFASLHHALD